MHENLGATKQIADLEGELEKVPGHREGKNIRYELVEAGMAAFAAFFVQSPSFLAAQREMKGRSNAEKLFGLREIPSDNQIQNLLNPLEPSWVGGEYWQLFGALKEGRLLDKFGSYEGQLLVLLDGTEYFSLKSILPNVPPWIWSPSASMPGIAIDGKSAANLSQRRASQFTLTSMALITTQGTPIGFRPFGPGRCSSPGTGPTCTKTGQLVLSMIVHKTSNNYHLNKKNGYVLRSAHWLKSSSARRSPPGFMRMIS